MSILVFWGHHVDEYMEMFDLTKKDLQGKLLEFASGPSAFNVEAGKIAKKIVSCDPLFNLDYDTLKTKASLVFSDMVRQVEAEQEKFDFSRYGSLQALAKKRQEGMDAFFADYKKGMDASRYLAINELKLPFDDFSFDYALSSHYLFSQLEDQSVEFHIQLLKELARVAHEVRIFPLIDRNAQPSPMLGPVLLGLQRENYGTEVRSVDYHLQPKGNAMLRVWAQECPV